MLKTGALLGAAAVLTSKKSLVLAQGAPPPLAQPVLCGTTPPVSPPTRPFLDTLAGAAAGAAADPESAADQGSEHRSW